MKNSKNYKFENSENTGEFHESAITPEYIKKTLQFKDSDVLHINITYPAFSVKSNKKTEKKINGFYNSIIRSFTNFCEKDLYKSAVREFLLSQHSQNNQDYREFKPFGAVIHFEIVYNRQGFVYVYLDINIYGGKGRGNVTRKTQIWDLATGELYPPKRIINFTPAVKKRICEHICRTMERQTERGEERYINTDMKSVYKYLNIDNLYLTEHGYAFFFPQGTLAPGNSGIVSFLVPQKVINGGEDT